MEKGVVEVFIGEWVVGVLSNDDDINQKIFHNSSPKIASLFCLILTNKNAEKGE